jgi:hypothetical protein
MSGKMALDLTSVHAKLRRAEQHFYTLKSEIKAWQHQQPYKYTTGVSPDFTKYFIVINKRIPCEAPIERWSLMIGDTVHNLRSALDHLVYAIAVHQTGQNPPPDENILAFPILKTSAKFTSFKS